MKKVVSVICGLLCVAILIFSPFLIKSESKQKSKDSVILTVWHVDAFEGGRGSRYTFLRNVSMTFSKENQGVYVLVSNFTVEGISSALTEGKVPDVISFGGVGLELDKKAKEINAIVKDGGDVNGKKYAVSYLKGGYFVIKKGSGEGNVILSKSQFTSPEIAYLFSGITNKNYTVKQTSDAYATFLREENSTLIGTQRDVERLTASNEQFTATPIPYYTDLYQYVALTTQSDKNEFYARRFINYLLSDKIQNKITSLNMLSVTKSGLYSDNVYLSALEKIEIKYTVSPFSSKEIYDLACENSIKAINNGGNYQEISNFLKQL